MRIWWLLLALLAASAVASRCALAERPVAPPKPTAVVMFHADWCGPCQSMKPLLARLEKAGVPVRRVNIDEEPGVTRHFNVQTVPTFVAVVDGDEKGRIVGATRLERLQRLADMVRRSER